jgi:hypothetical protein
MGQSIRDISELTDDEKLDLKYYNLQLKTQPFMDEKAMKIWEHFQNNPFSINVKIGEVNDGETIRNNLINRNNSK